jgi:type IV pilus assembly protein PilM
MPAAVIGLDVGTSAVRAVELELGNPPLIRRMGQVSLPAGAVVDGEVADVSAVSIALQRLWSDVGFKSKEVRVGMSSARVIVRTIEMPRLPRDELISTIQLQLDDYVPLPAAETVFNIRTMDGPEPTGQTQQLLLAATHHDAVQPLVMALAEAHLKVSAIDVIPAALALALTHPEPDQGDEVDILLSIGAGTVVVIAASGGEALFSRTLTSANGRRTTERIASELSIGEAEAELYKRLGATNDPTSALAMLATRPSVVELVEEVRASLEFYADQPSARRVRRLLVTGGGSLLPGLASALSEELGLEVLAADPFENVRMGHTGFEPCDLPYLAPYMAAALGVALGATRPKDRRIDLNPVAKRTSRSLNPRRVLVGVGAVVLVGAAGAFYVNGRGALADEQERLASAQVHLGDLRAQIIERDAASDPALAAGAASSDATPAAVAASVAATNIDWIAVEAAVRAGSTPLGVVISSFQGVLEPAIEAPAAVPPPSAAGDPSAATVPPDIPVADPVAISAALGTVTLTATAPNLLAIADWLDSIAADPRFADSWASGITVIAQPDGSSSVQLTMEMDLTTENLVDHSTAVEVPA